jgi:hypothetical protein
LHYWLWLCFSLCGLFFFFFFFSATSSYTKTRLPACKALENERKGERDVGPGNLDVDVSSDLAVRGGAATSSSSSSYVLLWTVRKGMVAGAAFCGDC